MFYLLRSNRAFNRTTAHPLDSAVRIAHHEDDLAALHYRNKTRAVIFKRPLPADVIADMQRYERIQKKSPLLTERIAQATLSPDFKITPFSSTCDSSVMSDVLQTCPALISDILHVSGIFRRAAGLWQFASEGGLYMAEWFTDMNNEKTRQSSFWLIEPHIDRPADNHRRMTCAYAANTKGMGTGWFPGTFDKAEARAIAKEYTTASNPEDVLKKYNYQTTDAGDLCFFHTDFSGDGKDTTKLSLLHKSPMPPVLKSRLCLLLPT